MDWYDGHLEIALYRGIRFPIRLEKPDAPELPTMAAGMDIVPYGQRLLIQVIDERAAAGHSRPYASIAQGGNFEDGFQDVSYGSFANAINRCAHWLLDRFGCSSSYETIAYIGPLDLRYNILAMAAVKTGHVVRTT